MALAPLVDRNAYIFAGSLPALIPNGGPGATHQDCAVTRAIIAYLDCNPQHKKPWSTETIVPAILVAQIASHREIHTFVTSRLKTDCYDFPIGLQGGREGASIQVPK